MGRSRRAGRRNARGADFSLGILLALNSASGLLNLLAAPPFGWHRLAFVCLIPHLLFLVHEPRPARLALGVACFQTIRFLGLGSYFFDPLFGAIYVALALPIVWLLSLDAALAPRRNQVRRLIIAAVAFVLVEQLQAALSPLPAYLATSGALLGSSPYLGLARWGGVVGLSVFVVGMNALLSYALLPSRRNPCQSPQVLTCIAVAVLATLAFGLLASQHLLAANRDAYARRPKISTVVAVSVSGGFAEGVAQYWDDESHDEAAAIAQHEVTRLADTLAQGPTQTDLLVLPEDMIDFEFWHHADADTEQRFGISNAGPLLALYRALARERQSELLCVLTTLERDGRYNSALLLDREGAPVAVAHKTVLALAMESWPFDGWHPFYFDWVMNAARRRASPVYNTAYRYRPGTTAGLFTTDQGLVFGSPICIELHHPWRMRELVARGAQALVHTSSDMAIERALPQYTAQTMQMRRILAVWLRIPIVFAGRRDDAGVVFPDGSVEGVAPEAQPFAVYWGRLRHDG